MLVISVIEAEDFGDELYPVMRENLTGLIEQQRAGLIIAAGDSRGMIYRLLNELSVEYPHVFCTILLSNDKLAYEGGSKECPHIFSLDCSIVYDSHGNAKQKLREKLIDLSDIIICRKKNYDKIRKISYQCDILAF